ncbi:Threonyl-tRNA synthetase [Desulfatibacillum aliphaticivorans]|uniref:Threonine--tRNA ligase n=1 Tax=Desulfatibacillum aliphaticivorans TaxID=218208 RepID=SYT_DESAL|nr:threonine--tRNA ligase [Desulfatibacillum aliphaticivorans]B8FN26.1 RecName: Full=Threonine--tRNA ligase; AltName: Full=Threonyl-tRNA synthetase; Short=ThrRS [Desulfatibacillum aliphaticivorans]ACL05896.1 Threonyl-tRNA synthetase [Desulfatibacillum aliphaticivorans]
MINITLPDGKIVESDGPVSGEDVAKGISEGFARNCVAVEVDGKLTDLSTPIETDASVVFITTKDEQGLDIMRHSAAHVMAEAILNLYPDAKLTIGPVIEDGFYYDIDMPPISEDDFPKIEQEINKIIKAKKPFVRKTLSKAEALDFYKDNAFKTELISELEDGTISIYEQGGFTDLCRGPHVPNTGLVKTLKLMKVSGAYWRGDSERPMLQRLYGTAFFDKKELKSYLHLLEEAKKRDHRKLGTALDLFSFHEEAAGMPFFHARGMELWNALLAYWREEHKKAGYVETKTPIMLNKSLWERSGHWENYRENMYTSLIEDFDYAIKPMNCPGGMLLYKTKHHSYNDLPIRAGEIGLVHRHELSGVLSGLFRVRAFHQDDAHIFMTEEMIEDEILGVLQLVERMYSTFGLGFHLELSTRPEKTIGTDEQWEKATEGLRAALDKSGRDYKINEGDGAFYGPKIDIHIKDALGRTWQCGTIQLDMNLPERFDLTYVGADNQRHRPVMIHRVIYGSIERFLGILIEHYAGKFPLWLSPCQAVVLAMNDDVAGYAKEVKARLEEAGLRMEIDLRAESINKKVRDAQLSKIPLMLTVGGKEEAAQTLAVRTLDGKVKYGVTIDNFLDKVLPHIETRNPDLVEF